jgi:hypothetical protein
VNPIKTLREAVTLPFTAIFVVGICTFINWTTTPGHWWVQWVILGMGIAVISAWARAIKLLVAAGALTAVGTLAYRAWGDAGRERVRRWVDSSR